VLTYGKWVNTLFPTRYLKGQASEFVGTVEYIAPIRWRVSLSFSRRTRDAASFGREVVFHVGIGWRTYVSLVYGAFFDPKKNL